MSSGVQLHRVHRHAIERAREIRCRTGVEYSAEIDGPVRITTGDLELRPETLNRTVWFISVMLAIGRQKNGCRSVANITDAVSHERSYDRNGSRRADMWSDPIINSPIGHKKSPLYVIEHLPRPDETELLSVMLALQN